MGLRGMVTVQGGGRTEVGGRHRGRAQWEEEQSERLHGERYRGVGYRRMCAEGWAQSDGKEGRVTERVGTDYRGRCTKGLGTEGAVVGTDGAKGT